jgi:hypothetical protein
MTATESSLPAPRRAPVDTVCAQCGARLDDEQEWCLECGGARTLIHPPPDWRVPVVVIGAVVAAAIAALVIALLNISSPGAAPSAAQSVASAPPATTVPGPAAATTTTTAGRVNIATWPPGLPGWTAVLAHSRSQQVADRDAAKVARAGIQVGVLDSTQHPALAPGFWVVFSGRYPTQAAALAASEHLISLGQLAAHPRLVGRPGGP